MLLEIFTRRCPVFFPEYSSEREGVAETALFREVAYTCLRVLVSQSQEVCQPESVEQGRKTQSKFVVREFGGITAVGSQVGCKLLNSVVAIGKERWFISK